MKSIVLVVGCSVMSAAVAATTLPQDATPVLTALRSELDRSVTTFKAQPVPAYFIAYEVVENRSTYASGSFGALIGSGQYANRQLDVDLRVGDYKLDNTHPLRGRAAMPAQLMGGGSTAVPIEDSPDALRAALWYQTDRRYKAAVEQLTKVKTDVKVNVAEEDPSPDFCAEPAEVYAEPVASVVVDKKALEDKVRRYTAPFAADPHIYAAQASINVDVQTRWYVNSEGCLIQTSSPLCRIVISATTKAEDGMDLPRHQTYFAFRPENLPSDDVVLASVKQMIADLDALRTAPLVDPYTGPAILSGRAAGVFFHEVFGHRDEGHRQKNVNEGQTFKKQLNKPLLPEGFTVFADPTLTKFGSTDLGGYYRYDDEGVKARRVTLIENGVLKGFMMARMPIEGFPESNGHGRKQPGRAVVARQSNLVVEAAKTVSRAELKQQLLDLVKQQGKPYGLIFDDIEGGFTLTGRTIPNAFNVLPIMVHRVFPDGREEVVRGVDLIGTPLTTFSKVIAADDSPDVFNGVCGAESGAVPVSSVSPGLLISQVEVQKKTKAQDRLPILPPPPTTPAATTTVKL